MTDLDATTEITLTEPWHGDLVDPTTAFSALPPPPHPCSPAAAVALDLRRIPIRVGSDVRRASRCIVADVGHARAGFAAARAGLNRWHTHHKHAWMLAAYEKAVTDGERTTVFSTGAAFLEHETKVADTLARHRRVTTIATIAIALLLGLLAYSSLLIVLISAVAVLVGFVRKGRRLGVEAAPEAVTAEDEPDPVTTDDIVCAVGRLVKPKAIDSDEAVQVLAMRSETNGRSVDLKLPAGAISADAFGQQDRIAGQLDVAATRVILEPGHTPRRLTVWLADTDPLTGRARESTLVDAEQVDLWSGFEFASSVRGERVCADLIGTHVLIGGDSGSGKTFLALLLAMAIALDPHAQLVICDPQGLGAWAALLPVAEVIEGRTDADVKAMADRLTAVAEKEFERRRKAIAEYAVAYPMRCPEAKLTRSMARDPELGLPLLCVFLDECHTLFNHPKYGQQIKDACQEITTRGRAFGVSLVALTQKASVKNIPSEVRDIFMSRACLSMPNGASVTQVLGDGWKERGMNPVALQVPDHAGAVYLTGGIVKSPKPQARWVLARTDNIDINQVRRVVADCAEMRARVRPELLPAASRPAEVTAVAELAANDPTRLVHLLEAFNGRTWATSVDLIEHLQANHPQHYAGLTPRGMNAFLAPFRLATGPVGGDRLAGLFAVDVTTARGESKG